MKQLNLCALALLALILVGCTNNEPSLPKTEMVQTPAGHSIHYITLDTELVSINAAFPSNYIFGEGNNPAVPHIGLRLIQQGGAGTIEPERLLEDFAEHDAEASLYAQTRYLRGNLSAEVYKIEEAAKLANMVLSTANLDERWFNRIKGNLIEAAHADLKNSGVMAWSALRTLAFDDKTARFWTASVDDITAVQLDDVKKWYVQSFDASSAIIVVSGPEDKSSALRAIDNLLQGLDQQEPDLVAQEPEKFELPNKTILIENPAANDATLILVDSLTGDAREQEIETLVALHTLGGTSESRLHRKLRDDLRATYEAHAQFVDFNRTVRLIAISAQVEIAKLEEALVATSDTYDLMRSAGQADDEFQKAKEIYQSHFETIINEESLPSTIVLEMLIDGKELDAVKKMMSDFGGMSTAKHNDFIAQNLHPSAQLARIIVAPNIDEIDIAVDCRIKNAADFDMCK